MLNRVIKQSDGHYIIENEQGAVLGMSELRLKEADGLVFKNLSGMPELLPYEDWRLPAEQRAKDLAERLSVEEIAGLMLFSPHQMVPFLPGNPFVGHYGGADFVEGETDPAALTDEQIDFVCKKYLRNFLLNQTQSAQAAAAWNNRIQALAETQPWGIPICISSDPRHAAGDRAAEFSSAGQDVSRWPEGLGMAAAFSPELTRTFAEIVSREYRALGICVALGPQIDLATEPRWVRYEDTWGGQVDLVTAMTKAYCDGMQTTPGKPDGWGNESVAVMVKHWPGGGTGEGGRDAHYTYGKYAVFPGGRLKEHIKPFADGAFCLEGPTQKAAAVMPYYTVSWEQDRKYGENVGNSYSRYIVGDLLRGEYGYDGVVCTDWGITEDPAPNVGDFGSRCFGVEQLDEAERHLKILMNGVDMFGGNSKAEPVVAAYHLGCARCGKESMERRFRESAARILKMVFRLGLFENPYLDVAESAATVGKREFVEAGLDAQRRSVVLLKNKGEALPLRRGCSIYVPARQIGAYIDFFRRPQPERSVTPLTQGEADGWFRLVDDPSQADAAVVFVESPLSDGYSTEDAEQGGNGYVPISLQYRPYQAVSAREESIAGGDFRERDTNRSYRGKTGTARNENDLDLILDTGKQMGNKPVIVCMRIHNPAVVSEFEPCANAILAHFGVDNSVLLDILCGESAPQGRLPLTMPASMETVERHCEDVFNDIEPYTDQCGNQYRFGFGLTYEES